MVRRLEEVFGIHELRPYSYVDRGDLDTQLAYWLRTDRHIAIHGDSKQGKTWLRERALSEDMIVHVQCTSTSTASGLLTEAMGRLGVRAEIRYTTEKTLTGTLDLGASGSFGALLFAKAKAQGKLTGQVGRRQSTESAPVGRTPADLSWISFVLVESGRRLVLEDFHYLSRDEQQRFSFLMRAMEGYGVRVVVVGVWAEDHLLTFHNGDLDGRVEDVHLEWKDSELRAVIDKGCQELNIRFPDALIANIIADSFGNVGLLQRLMERVCIHAGFLTRERGRRDLNDSAFLVRARESVASSMAGRFDTFATRMRVHSPTLEHVVATVLAASDNQLRSGITVTDFASRCMRPDGTRRYSEAVMRTRLESLSEAQSTASVSPPVLSFDTVGDRLFAVDRALLFYRKYATSPFTASRV